MNSSSRATVWEVSKYGVEKYGAEKIPYFDTFHTVHNIILSLLTHFTHEKESSSWRSSSSSNKIMADVMKKKQSWTPSLISTEESTVNQNSFRVLIILYITNFCETRETTTNAIWVLFLLLNFRKNRKCALN